MEVKQGEPDFFNAVQMIMFLVLTSLIFVTTSGGYFIYLQGANSNAKTASLMFSSPAPKEKMLWQPPDSTLIPKTKEGQLILYGKELVQHTARYLGPQGTVKKISNGLNCQSCHLNAGTRPFANNFAAVSSTYPRFRSRSGALESMEKRINDCLERSLNGTTLEENSLEMRAMIAWFQWLGQSVPKDSVPPGTRIPMLSFLTRAADPAEGKKVYEKHCLVCHGVEGKGLRHPDGVEWTYPPLAGANSYNTAAGMYRISLFAAYVKNNMPFGTTYDNPVLTDAEAWDVAAYVNSLPRPVRIFPEDWPDISTKPFDHPFGPYADSFSEAQHKYGPFSAFAKNR
ncbi:MAG TPA: c-type cytochrome [Chryseosolibacter sp.]|nr:c-type cytochrome [Chryseosolibacter sp.]